MHEVIANCDPEYVPLYDTGVEDKESKHDLVYPESTHDFAERLHNTTEHLVTEAHGPNGLKMGAILMISHYAAFDKVGSTLHTLRLDVCCIQVISDLVSNDSNAGWESDPMGDKSPPLAGLVKLQCRMGWNGEVDQNEHKPRWGICCVDHDYLTTGDLCDIESDKPPEQK